MSSPGETNNRCNCGEDSVPTNYDVLIADIWDLYVGDSEKRVGVYRDFLTKLLRSKNCHHVLDLSCGIGTDSIMLLEEGFQLTSVDIAYKMLQSAQDTRWERRKEQAFDSWVIKNANWLTLQEDLGGAGPFDALICLGNSFVLLLNEALQKQALKNFADMMKPGGVLVMDHVNFDSYLDGKEPDLRHNIYYSWQGVKTSKVSLLYEDGRPCVMKRICEIDVTDLPTDLANKYRKFNGKTFSTRIFPHRMADVQRLLKDAFGESAKYEVFGEYKPLNEIENPAFYVHVVQKPL